MSSVHFLPLCLPTIKPPLTGLELIHSHMLVTPQQRGVRYPEGLLSSQLYQWIVPLTGIPTMRAYSVMPNCFPGQGSYKPCNQCWHNLPPWYCMCTCNKDYHIHRWIDKRPSLCYYSSSKGLWHWMVIVYPLPPEQACSSFPSLHTQSNRWPDG